MATLVSKVRAISKSTASETTSTDVVNFLNMGAIFVVNAIPKELLTFMASDSAAITDGNGYDILNDRVVMVRRAGITCDELPPEKIYAHASSLGATSLFAGSGTFPKFYIQNGKVFIKPDPDGSNTGYVTKVTPPTIDGTTTSTTLDEIENPVILYAAALDLMALSQYWGNTGLSSIFVSGGAGRDALDKARDLIDNSTALSNGQDVEFYIDDEDTEMIIAGVQVAAQEVNRALAELKSVDSSSSLTMQILEKSNKMFELAHAEVDKYVQRNSRALGLTQGGNQ